MDPLDGLKGIKRDDSFSLSNKFRKVKIWNCEREERTTRKKKKEGEEEIEGKTENNDRRWWRNETIFLVPRGIRDMCIHRSIQMGRSGYAFKESAYDGKVSRRVACTYVDSHIYIYIYTHYIYVYTQGTRCSETKECSMSYEHEGVQGLRSRKQAALSLPEYISVTAYRVCMKRFKYLNYPLFDKFSLATFERSVTLSETNRSESLIRVALQKERKCGYLVSLRRNEKYFFFSPPSLFFLSAQSDSIRLRTRRE